MKNTDVSRKDKSKKRSCMRDGRRRCADKQSGDWLDHVQCMEDSRRAINKNKQGT